MKIWQLAAVLSEEACIFDKFFEGIDTVQTGRDEVDDDIVVEALSQSHQKYYVTRNNYLRLMPSSKEFSVGMEPIEEMPVLEAFERYGGDAITEAVDYGSFDLSKLKSNNLYNTSDI